MLTSAKAISAINILGLLVHDSDFVYIRIYLRCSCINTTRGAITSYLRYVLNNVYIKYLLYNEHLSTHG